MDKKEIERIGTERIGWIIGGRLFNRDIGRYSHELAARQLAEKLNEIIDYINTQNE